MSWLWILFRCPGFNWVWFRTQGHCSLEFYQDEKIIFSLNPENFVETMRGWGSARFFGVKKGISNPVRKRTTKQKPCSPNIDFFQPEGGGGSNRLFWDGWKVRWAFFRCQGIFRIWRKKFRELFSFFSEANDCWRPQWGYVRSSCPRDAQWSLLYVFTIQYHRLSLCQNCVENMISRNCQFSVVKISKCVCSRTVSDAEWEKHQLHFDAFFCLQLHKDQRSPVNPDFTHIDIV